MTTFFQRVLSMFEAIGRQRAAGALRRLASTYPQLEKQLIDTADELYKAKTVYKAQGSEYNTYYHEAHHRT